eukprot:1381434-Amorphochlora_amoeboformis.AAC.1
MHNSWHMYEDIPNNTVVAAGGIAFAAVLSYYWYRGRTYDPLAGGLIGEGQDTAESEGEFTQLSGSKSTSLPGETTQPNGPVEVNMNPKLGGKPSSTKLPEDEKLPPGWTKHIHAETKKIFYFNKKKGLSSWSYPQTSDEDVVPLMYA